MGESWIGSDLWRQLRAQIARRTRNPANAEDLLHAAYLRLQRYSCQNEVKNPGAFLVRAACNISIDNYRQERVWRAPELADLFDAKDDAPLQDEILEGRARLTRVRDGLNRLTPRTREIFLMHRLDNLKYQEIAHRLGISTSAVEKHVAKAMLFLTEWTEGW